MMMEVDRDTLHDPGTPQADHYRADFDRFVALIAERREAMPRPANSPLAGNIGGDAWYYLTADEGNAYSEACAQIAHQERVAARERVAAKRAIRLQSAETTQGRENHEQTD